MKLNQIAVICSGIGIALVVSSICLKYFILPEIPATATWSQEEAEAYTQAAMTYHAKSFDKRVDEAELAETAAEYESHRKGLDAAIAGRRNLPQYFQYSGIGFVLMGAIFYLVAQVRAEDAS